MNIERYARPQTVVKYIALYLTVLFIGIVTIERFPGVLVDTAVPHEWLMFGLFKISLIDDITHGLSGLFGLLAILSGYRWTVKYLMVIGGYYALDALFTVGNGFAIGQDFISNMLLNGPHIGITVLVLIALYSSVRRIELK
ncbi:MAG: hypothetical protein JWM46_874 [Candidatus Kaiserbacteria bacterium]|nr:hypothetical protein [Candidatus Kaiserbacteria bacterium]